MGEQFTETEVINERLLQEKTTRKVDDVEV